MDKTGITKKEYKDYISQLFKKKNREEILMLINNKYINKLPVPFESTKVEKFTESLLSSAYLILNIIKNETPS